jgi:hypothetical protein
MEPQEHIVPPSVSLTHLLIVAFFFRPACAEIAQERLQHRRQCEECTLVQAAAASNNSREAT